MTAKRVTFPDKNENAPRGSVERRIWDADINQIKEAINDHSDRLDLGGSSYRVFESMPSLEDLADGEVAFVVSGGVVPDPDPDPDPELVNIVTQVSSPVFTGSSLSSSNVAGVSDWSHAWNETILPANDFENGTVISSFADGVPNYEFSRRINVDLGTGYVVKKLRMWGGDFNTCVNEFILQGSNNNSTWTDLIEDNLLRNGNHQTFTVDTPASYRYYRIRVFSNHQPLTVSRVTFWDVRLLGDAI